MIPVCSVHGIQMTPLFHPSWFCIRCETPIKQHSISKSGRWTRTINPVTDIPVPEDTRWERFVENPPARWTKINTGNVAQYNNGSVGKCFGTRLIEISNMEEE